MARCHLRLAGDRCHGFVDSTTVTADRLNAGGTYRHGNIQPACAPCQSYQGALITNTARWAWRSLMAEARDAGIEWDGVMPQRTTPAAS